MTENSDAKAAAPRRRAAAIAALVLAAATLCLAVAAAIDRFPHGLLVLAGLALALACGWFGIRRRGGRRIAGLAAGALLVVAAIVAVALQGGVLVNLLILAGVLLTLAAASRAFSTRAELAEVSRPAHPVLIMNPRSGGGKATRFHLADEARARGIRAVEMEPGDDLRDLVRAAIAQGADALAMAGGDGSQAIVAEMAAADGLPYACIPAGTRNHFALDLGVDRDDVVGALDAFVEGRERVVDLAEVNGRVFVNNVSLGLYAEAVQQSGYRDAKIRTILATVPDVMGPSGRPLDLRWTAPDGTAHETAATILVSNNQYRLGRLIGSGTRPRMDEHVLGVAVIDPGGNGAPRSRLMQEWTAEDLKIESSASVPAGVDGEAIELTSPVSFRIRPDALRVRIAAQHPGASPSASQPAGLGATIRSLFHTAVSRA